MTRAQALGGNQFPATALRSMAVVTVRYKGFDGRLHQGQIVVNRKVAREVAQIFEEIRASGYPIRKVVPIVKYGWHDQASIDDDNTSAFNYRHVIGPGQDTRQLSLHSYGRAIDLDPFENPFMPAHGPGPRPYDPSKPGTLTKDSAVTKIFLRHGWRWGGNYAGAKDYQHFDKGKGW